MHGAHIFVFSLFWRARSRIQANGSSTRAKQSNSYAPAFRKAMVMLRNHPGVCCGFYHLITFNTRPLPHSLQQHILNIWPQKGLQSNVLVALYNPMNYLHWPNHRYYIFPYLEATSMIRNKMSMLQTLLKTNYD